MKACKTLIKEKTVFLTRKCKMSEKRSANFTPIEEMLLVDLATKYNAIIECKITDHINNIKKKQIWTTIANEFNAEFPEGIERTGETLRTKYNNLKKRTKQKFANEDSVCLSVPVLTKSRKELHDKVQQWAEEKAKCQEATVQLHIEEKKAKIQFMKEEHELHMKHATELHEQQLKFSAEIHELQLQEIKARIKVITGSD